MTTKYVEPVLSGRTNDINSFKSPNLVSLLETAEGDLILGGDDDGAIANLHESVAQRLLWFIKTPIGSSELYPEFGSRIHQLFGQSSDNPLVLEGATSNLIEDLVSQGFDPIIDKTEVLPYAPGIIIIHVAVRNDLENHPIVPVIEQTYNMSSDNQTIEFLGAQSY
jgi:hypothetical protein